MNPFFLLLMYFGAGVIVYLCAHVFENYKKGMGVEIRIGKIDRIAVAAFLFAIVFWPVILFEIVIQWDDISHSRHVQ